MSEGSRGQSVVVVAVISLAVGVALGIVADRYLAPPRKVEIVLPQLEGQGGAGQEKKTFGTVAGAVGGAKESRK